MSLKTWEKEFLPKIGKTVLRSQRSATEHCLQKWTGLLPSNLKRHNVVIYMGDLVDAGQEKKDWPCNRVWIDGSTCALCEKNYGEDEYSRTESFCTLCPIYKMTGKECAGDSNSPYSAWVSNDNPKPMIQLLKRTLKFVTKQPKK